MSKRESVSVGAAVAAFIVEIVTAVVSLVGSAWFVMLAFGMVHSVFDSVPPLGYIVALTVTGAVWLVGGVLRTLVGRG